MTQTQVLQKAIEIAISNGWEPVKGGEIDKWRVIDAYPRVFASFMMKREVITRYDDVYYEVKAYIPELIFNHDFARALFGDRDDDGMMYMTELYQFVRPWGEDKPGIYEAYEQPIWQYHLQQLVLAPDPLKYLEDNMPENK